MKTKEQIFTELKAPILLSWKMNNKIGTDKALMVAFIDSRDVQNRLDAVVGPENWSDEYHSEAGKLFCRLSIRLDGEWITKTDAGQDTQVAADKGASSDAFKRAAVKWGIGRYIYDIDNLIIKTVDYKGKTYPADDTGKPLWNPTLVSDFCNAKLEQQ